MKLPRHLESQISYESQCFRSADILVRSNTGTQIGVVAIGHFGTIPISVFQYFSFFPVSPSQTQSNPVKAKKSKTQS
jgi:hypothetical protein